MQSRNLSQTHEELIYAHPEYTKDSVHWQHLVSASKVYFDYCYCSLSPYFLIGAFPLEAYGSLLINIVIKAHIF